MQPDQALVPVPASETVPVPRARARAREAAEARLGWLRWARALAGVFSTLFLVFASQRVFRVRWHQPRTLAGMQRLLAGLPPSRARLRGGRSPTENPRHQVARQFLEEGIVGKSESIYRSLLARFPDHPDLNLELGELLLQRGDVAESWLWLDRASRADPARGEALARRAEAEVLLGAVPAGLTTRNQARNLGADLGAVDRHLALHYIAAKQYAQAIHFLERVDPEEEDAEVQASLAEAWFEKGRPRANSWTDWRIRWDVRSKERFLHHLKRARRLDPTLPILGRWKDWESP